MERLRNPFDFFKVIRSKIGFHAFFTTCSNSHEQAFIVTHNIEEAVLLADRIIVLGKKSGQDCLCFRPASGNFTWPISAATVAQGKLLILRWCFLAPSIYGRTPPCRLYRVFPYKSLWFKSFKLPPVSWPSPNAEVGQIWLPKSRPVSDRKAWNASVIAEYFLPQGGKCSPPWDWARRSEPRPIAGIPHAPAPLRQR